MKKILFGVLSLFLIAGTINAQDAKKALRSANKLLGKYNLDPVNNGDLLLEARTLIDKATEDKEYGILAKTWITKASICSELAALDFANFHVKGESYELQHPNASMSSYEAGIKALQYATKKYEKSDALEAITNAVPFLSNLGILKYGKGDFKGAFESFNTVLNAQKTLKTNGKDGVFENEKIYNDQVYMTGLAALNAGMTEEAGVHFMKLYEAQYDNPAVYDALFKSKVDDNPEEALKILVEGRTKYPEELALLYNEINYYLKNNQLDELVGKLEMAIKKDPENKSLYSTLGNVYDNLFSKESEAGNIDVAKGHFDNALTYYNQALEKDDQYFDALYSIGALYYNKAAFVSKEMVDLEDDFSKEGMRNYETKKSEVFALFDQALPYFKRAESVNSSDMGVLIALKEIFAKKDDLKLSNEFKSRIETISNGGKIEQPYFSK